MAMLTLLSTHTEEVVAMAALTVRGLDDETKARLRVRECGLHRTGARWRRKCALSFRTHCPSSRRSAGSVLAFMSGSRPRGASTLTCLPVAILVSAGGGLRNVIVLDTNVLSQLTRRPRSFTLIHYFVIVGFVDHQLGWSGRRAC